MNVIEFENVEKCFSGFRKKATKALDCLNLEVREGEIFGFLGPNGAGKSTAIKLLLNFISPDSGKLVLCGHNVGDEEFLQQIGYLAEFPCFYSKLTAIETLTFVGRLSGLGSSLLKQRIEQYLNRVNLLGASNQQVGTFSKGMKQRLGLAVALIHDPDVLILDEPMSGLDPIGRHLVKGIITEQREKGKTVFFSSHILTDIEELCDNIGVIHKGHLLYKGKLKNFQQGQQNLEQAFLVNIEKWDNANDI